MKEDISFCTFTDRFRDMDRKDNFTYNGLKALYDYLIDYEEDTDTEINLDVIALCCEYSEYKNINEFLKDYSNTVIKTERKDYEEDDLEQYEEDFLEELREYTPVIKIEDSNGFIIQCF